jgi:hypothetical protein
MKYISMKIDPKGRMPATGMRMLGSPYHAAAGIGLQYS